MPVNAPGHRRNEKLYPVHSNFRRIRGGFKAAQVETIHLDSQRLPQRFVGSRPVQRALFIKPDVPDQQNAQEHEHGNQRKRAHVLGQPGTI